MHNTIINKFKKLKLITTKETTETSKSYCNMKYYSTRFNTYIITIVECNYNLYRLKILFKYYTL